MQPAPLSPGQAAALRRARELVGELAALTAAVRAHLGETDAPAERESGLLEGEFRSAFAEAISPRRRHPGLANLLGG
jgi:hypothetical protein